MGDVFIATSLNSKIFYEKKQYIFGNLTTKKISNIRDRIRNEYETIIVGGNTIKKDNPNLLNTNQSNIRIVIDKYADLDINSNIFQNDPSKTYIILLRKNEKYRNKLLDLGVNAIYLKNATDKNIIRQIEKISIGKVLIEGGADTINFFLKNRYIENIKIVQFPIILPKNALGFGQYQEFAINCILKESFIIDKNYIYQCYKIENINIKKKN